MGMHVMRELLAKISPEQPVLIAGPTASGKSALALEIAQAQGGVILNADALQIFANWRVLTARPSAADEALAPHALYGFLPGDAAYSVGHWLRDIAPFLAAKARPIIVGGTGLYFSALTEGLAQIPPTPPEIRALADQRMAAEGPAGLLAELTAQDPKSAAKIDQLNPVRVQRAWEVLRSTGRGIAAWQEETPAPLLPLQKAAAFVVDAQRDWLAARIDRRFEMMINGGALEEARANLSTWDSSWPASKAIGAAELIAHLRGTLPLEEAQRLAQAATRQYAKRQRTWFRSRMKAWHKISSA
ncbi:MAG: tRNA (adenosine(37)-N6)-dimethylallyltransferase MiaA [Paracoccaceae bacterium]